ncbi:MAG: phosphodiester glycosidase family protein [Bacteroidales bacterium]|nr:phosphodiester glycosidase family protein [Bacteroidales bacterium]
MKRHSLYLIAVSIPLLVLSCRGEDLPDIIPPPTPVVDPDPTPVNPQPGGETHEWDKNRGKKVYPSGTGWTSTMVEEGITYYTFSGTDPVTKSPQRVFVTDVDLSNTDYSVKFALYDSRSTASAVMKDKKAIVTMNAGYERESIVIRVDGRTAFMMPNSTIGSTGVTNWKNEGCVMLDGVRDVRFGDTGRDLAYQDQQRAYMKLAPTVPNLLSSAPILIYDYEPMGETFVTRYPRQSSNSEDPYVHQSTNTHPRTVIAKNEFNHLLLIVIDGRRPTVSRGMSAAEVTQFLVTNFNPQYALNLDGGGSSTMCVQGQGDESTHVVNYPTDSDEVKGVPDHTGERSVPTFFYVVKN